MSLLRASILSEAEPNNREVEELSREQRESPGTKITEEQHAGIAFLTKNTGAMIEPMSAFGFYVVGGGGGLSFMRNFLLDTRNAIWLSVATIVCGKSDQLNQN